MSRSLGNTIADSLDQGRRYAQTLLAGIPAEQFARFAAPAGQPIVSNHPAFVFGHLALYPPKILKGVGGHPPDAGVPDSFLPLFAKEAVCQDDPDGSVYPPMEEIVTVFRTSHEAASENLRAAPDDVFGVENPVGGSFTERFPTVGSAITFYSGGHLLMHLGQISAWRRMAGLGAA